MSRRGPHVMAYDAEFGYVVAGTHDLDVAERVLRDRLTDLQPTDAWGQESGMLELDPDRPVHEQLSVRPPIRVWARVIPVRDHPNYSWMLKAEDKPDGKRGEFLAVEWTRPW